MFTKFFFSFLCFLLNIIIICKVFASKMLTRLSPKRFSSVGPLKQHPGCKHFADDDDVQHDVLLWMRQQPKEFHAAGIGVMIKRWDKCINIGGDYIEK
ncbi:hypothetical protein AVEN_107836-1 [Araneus ventricosus]|uniref:Uncharacterized protein n=1 Tax=Araneus ventricosus TaxID=182803 RepID=A0A4Y2R2M2_ARAVE|nr:hypothetical protein AVEN_107836-1 [Araneus ventricosus]